VIARDGAEWLTTLGRINAGQADLVLIIVGVQDGDGIAIGDLDHGAGEVSAYPTTR
jgi:hypothetical protein